MASASTSSSRAHTQERIRDENVINEQIKISIREIFDLDSNIEKDTLTLKVKIQHLAGDYEDLYNVQGFPEQVSEICSQLCRMWDKAGKSHLKQYTVKILDAKYKRIKSEQSTIQLQSQAYDLPEECSIMFEQLKISANELLNPKLGYLNRENIRELWDKCISAADNFESICKQFNISLLRNKDHDPLTDNQDQADNDSSNDKVQEEKPVSKMTPEELAKMPHILAMDKVINDLVIIRQALIDYPIEKGDPLLKDIEDSHNAIHYVMQHSSDKKFRRSLLQWNDILFEAGEQGGTSAASHSGVECAGLTDPKTGKPLFRNITKEQIDAIKLPMYNKMNAVIHHVPLWGNVFVSIDEHLRRYEERWRERRCELLSPKLQKKA